MATESSIIAAPVLPLPNPISLFQHIWSVAGLSIAVIATVA